nr:TIGR04255 family protein [uncultured Pseudomonas sp.]
MFQNKPNAEIRQLPHGLIHAVERLSLGVDWDEQLDAETMAQLSALGDRIVETLPRKIEISTSGLRATVAGVAKHSAEEADTELFAILFDDNKDHEGAIDDKLVEMVINNNGFGFAINSRYAGWEKTRSSALEMFGVFFKAISEKVSISSIDFRVSNVFGLKDFDGNLTDLLDIRCDSLPRRVFSSEGLWHLDEGYFDERAAPGMDQLLVNLHVSKARDGEETNLYVRTLHQFDMSEQSTNAIQLADLFEHFDHLHEVNKDLLASVLHENIVRALELFPIREGIV